MAGKSENPAAPREWERELAHCFAAKAAPDITRAGAPGLADLALNLLPQPTRTDVDVPHFVHLAVSHLASTLGAEGRELIARARAGAAFLFAGSSPSKQDLALIAEGNHVSLEALDPTSKLVRDTWAFLTYKRALGARRDLSFTQKRGQQLRPAFAEALTTALQVAKTSHATFQAHARAEQLADENLYGLDYSEKAPTSSAAAGNGRRVDRSRLVRDVTIPDGSRVPLGARFVKTWELQNVGNVPWIQRSLRRITVQAPTLPACATTTPIPDTWPGEFVEISVEMVAARVQGASQITFKMVDRDGALCFPSRYAHGLTMLIETGGFEWITKEVSG